MAQYEPGDYIKVEFDSSVAGLASEWMWVRVHRCDEHNELVYGALDNEPIANGADLHLGHELAIHYKKIREHKKPWEFHKN